MNRLRTSVSLLIALTGGCAAVLGLDAYEPDGRAPVGTDGGGDADLDASADSPFQTLTCGTTKCMAHEVCADSGVSCTCATGYAREGAACVFRGGPLDPDFANTPVAWVVDGGAVLDAGASGPTGPGVAVLLGGSILQTFDMPAFASAESLALTMTARDDGCQGNQPCPELSFGIGGVNLTPPAGAFGALRHCLGERAFGPATTLGFSGGSVTTLFDRAEYRLDSTCPVPGTVRSGDFSTLDAWSVSGTVAVVDGIGVGGTRAARLTGSSCKETGVLVGESSVPILAGSALRLMQRGTAGRYLHVLGANVPARAALGADTVCFPRYAHGYAFPVGLSVAPSFVVPCPGDAEVVVDDITLVNTATCGSGFLFDGGFEEDISYWTLTASGARQETAATISTLSQQARTGTRSLLINTGQAPGIGPPEVASGSQAITVPPAAAGAGPAVTFWYRTGSGSGAGGPKRFIVSGTVLPEQLSYAKYTLCLPPSRSSRRFDLTFQISNASFDNGMMSVDDVTVGTDASCPTR